MRKPTLCSSCGGTAILEGTEDDYTVTCNHCDPRGPVVSFQVVNGVPLPPIGQLRRDLELGN